MLLALLIVLVWGLAAFGVWCLARAAGRADRGAELIAAAERDTPAPLPGSDPAPAAPAEGQEARAVWIANERLSWPLAWGVAARRLQERNARRALG